MKGKTLSLALSLVAILLLWSCQDKPVKDLTSLEGSWNLVEYIPGNGSDEWKKYDDSIIYQKHLSADHFIWFKYNSATEEILGMGGGTYRMKDGKYHENIQFFYPPGSSELGQSIPFDYKLTGNNWYHKGYSKEMQLDMESGDVEVIDSTKIEEQWVKTKITPNENETLVGTWDLISYRDSLKGKYTEFPDFVGYMKLLTKTHFTWVYYDIDGDEVFAAGSGPYTYDGQSYKETISFMHPNNTGQVGETINFKANIDNNSWKHLGYLPLLTIDSNTGMIKKDSSLIDERWALHNEEVYGGIIF